jgi:GTP-binding protein TypA/BipA
MKINIVDTPGHADFGGEVERVLKMVDGVLLLVDSFEGPMPQTRFVLHKALNLKLPVIVVINKVDRPDARCEEVVDEVLDLFIDLGADATALDRPIVYASAREGTATLDMKEPSLDLRPLFETILSHIPAPEGDMDAPAQVLISTIDYNEYVGRFGIGRINRGTLATGMTVVKTNYDTGAVSQPLRLTSLYTFDGLKRLPAETASMGDIVAMSGLEDIQIGDTVCDPAAVEALPFVSITEPTVVMTFSVNNSPFAGREGTYVTSRHLRARLFKELQTRREPARERNRQPRRLRGARPGRIAPEHPHREHAPSGVRVPGQQAAGHLSGDRRQKVRADRADGGGRAPGLRRRRDREDRAAAAERWRTCTASAAVRLEFPHSFPRAVRLPQRVYDRHAPARAS